MLPKSRQWISHDKLADLGYATRDDQINLVGSLSSVPGEPPVLM